MFMYNSNCTFYYYSNPPVHCDTIPKLNLNQWRDGSAHHRPAPHNRPRPRATRNPFSFRSFNFNLPPMNPRSNFFSANY
ncbi:hypothetical protein EB796_012537 [Bugula neritina]|uniref:Uncharacterized protein n=1 Tax=Bugula neritina TaxID=10212 RepID=A0A7J7JS19_BUGNE|nr:hypothetical protein EB796_012537 [Bugula neritina]